MAVSEPNRNPMNKPVNRRNFLGFVVTLFGMLWGALTLYPIYRYLRPPARPAGQGTVSSVVVGAADDIPVGTGRNFQFGSAPAILVHTEEGQYHAFNAICTHLGCTVQYRPDMERIWCACHGGVYDPNTGRVLAGPPPRPLEALQATVQEGQIIVSRPGVTPQVPTEGEVPPTGVPETEARAAGS